MFYTRLRWTQNVNYESKVDRGFLGANCEIACNGPGAEGMRYGFDAEENVGRRRADVITVELPNEEQTPWNGTLI